VRRALVGAAIVAFVAQPATTQAAESRDAVVVIVDGVSFPDLLSDPGLRSLASHGGAALMNGRADLRGTFPDTFFPPRAIGRLPFTYVDLATAPPSEAARVVANELRGVEDPTLAMVVSVSPSAASAADGDELGAVIAAWGDPDELLSARGEPRALTSDSTRRAGVVATVDPAATVAEWLVTPHDAGAPIRTTDEPAPLDLYRRYLQQRRLAVPVAAVSWTLMGLAGVAGLLALRARRRASDRTLAWAGSLVATLPWLALALLLVGHLPSLTVWTVTPFLVGVMAAGVAASRWVADRRGILYAMAFTGAVILAALAVESVTGWQAAVTPLAGGGQLDGGRFFGMGNAEIGLVLGAAIFLAQRLDVRAGVALLLACALVTGSPWTGANFGSAITLYAAAGLWLGVRERRPWWWTALASAAITAIGMGVIAVMHRYLTSRPTHVTAFVEHGGGVMGGIEHFVDRLGIGLRLLADSPFSILPVVGTIVLLVVVLRPPPAVAASFEGREAWRDAALVLVLGSIVAYLANDTGAAALGFGFGAALSGLLDVSLTTAREKMRR
jgi:hypothetical protein